MTSHLYESHKFSEGISRDMRIPERIGAKGALDSGAKGFSVDPSYPTFSNIVEDMSIPDKILATGEAGAVVTPTYDPLDPSLQVRPSDLISIDSPPDTITLDRMPYPDIRSEQHEGGRPTSRRRRSERSGGESGLDVGGGAGSGIGVTLPPPGVPASLPMSVLRLQKRLEALEAENEQRRRRELVLYPAIGLYFLFKIIGWFVRPRRAPGGF